MDFSDRLISITDELKMIKPSSPHWPIQAHLYVFKDGEGIMDSQRIGENFLQTKTVILAAI